MIDLLCGVAWASKLCASKLVVQGIMPDILQSLSDFLTVPEFSRKAMNLLGKLGGRSYSHINGPQDLKYEANAEQGLRVTLKFQEPTTRILIPFDRIIQFVTTDWSPATESVHQRKHVFGFVKTCLAMMMGLDARAQCFGEDVASEKAAEQLLLAVAAMLPVPSPVATQLHKSKLQQAAEEQCLQVSLCSDIDCARE
jgi:hypothetical protein